MERVTGGGVGGVPRGTLPGVYLREVEGRTNGGTLLLGVECGP